MKTPLRYQMSDFDCGSVSLLNCLSYLFEREEIPTELVRVVSTYSLTFYDVKGRLDKTTTQKSLPFYISAWINKFALQKRIPLKSKFLKGSEATIYELVECLKQGGCVNMKTYRGDDVQYVAVTAIDDEFVYLFDPHFKIGWDYKNSTTVEVIDDNPFAFNRRVAIEQFLSERPIEYAMGPAMHREMVVLKRSDASLERELG